MLNGIWLTRPKSRIKILFALLKIEKCVIILNQILNKFKSGNEKTIVLHDNIFYFLRHYFGAVFARDSR